MTREKRIIALGRCKADDLHLIDWATGWVCGGRGTGVPVNGSMNDRKKFG